MQEIKNLKKTLSQNALSEISMIQETNFQTSSESSNKCLFSGNISPTTSLESTLMGSAESFAQASASKKKRQVLDTSTSLQQQEFSSSDSEITDFDIFFRTSLSSKNTSITSPEQEKLQKSLPNFKKNKRDTVELDCIEKKTRFLREPPEKDKDTFDTFVMSDNDTSNDLIQGYVDSIQLSETNNQPLGNQNRCCSCPIKTEKYYNLGMLNKAYSDPRSCDRNYNHNKIRPCFKIDASENTEYDINGTVNIDKNISPEHTKYLKTKEKYRCSYTPIPPPFPEKPRKYCCENCHYMYQHKDCEETNLPELTQLNMGDDDISCSDLCSSFEYPDLVYQHTEEYLDLVNELGETLSLRNKKRVETTIREFEFLSRQNKTLNKPLFDDEDGETENVDKKIHCCCCACCKRPRTCQPILSSKAKSDRDAMRLSSRPHKFVKQPPIHTNHPTDQPIRWQRDHRTGRWYKICNNTDFEDKLSRPSAKLRYNSVSSSSSHHQKICKCDNCCTRYNSKFNPSSYEDGYKNSSEICRCNCEYSCDTWY